MAYSRKALASIGLGLLSLGLAHPGLAREGAADMACGFEAGRPRGGKLEARLAGLELPGALRPRFLVRQEAGRPDTVTLVLRGGKALRFAAGLKVGDDAQVHERLRHAEAALFSGEIVGIEPESHPRSQVIIRARNRLHRLAGEPQSRTFFDTTDEQIVESIAAANGLEAASSGDLSARHDQVVQANQTDLEFLRSRAALIGYEVLVEDTKLLFRMQASPRTVPFVCRRHDDGIQLQLLYTQLSSSRTVQRVVLRGSDDTGVEHVGVAQAPTVLLQRGENDPDRLLGGTAEFTVDEPIFSAEEANTIAEAKLGELTFALLSGEALLRGNALLRVGLVAEVAGMGDRFDGKYVVQGVTHRYSPGGGRGGYTSVLRVKRDAQAYHPEIDDEVLVVFERGDLRRPFVVGSLWNDDDDPPEEEDD